MYYILAWRNIWRNRRRTIITLSSISFAVFFACVMQSMQRGAYDRMIDNTVRFSTGHIQIHAKGYWDDRVIDNSIEWNDNETLVNLDTEIPEILATTPRLESFALASYEEKTKGAMVVGIDPVREKTITNLDKKLVEGEYLSDEPGVLIGKGLASFLNLNTGDTLVLISQGYHGMSAAGKFPITGIIQFPTLEFNQQAVFMNLREAQHFYAADRLITSLSILLEDSKDVEKIRKQLADKLDPEVYEVMTWQEMMPELVQSIELDYYSGFIIILILYAVIAFGIFGTFLMMTRERTYEFGILTAIGMKKRKIQVMVALEIVMLILLGISGGILLSMPILVYLYYNPIYLSGDIATVYENFGFEPILPFSLEPRIFLNQAVVVLVIASLLAIYPMIVIQSLRTVKALKE